MSNTYSVGDIIGRTLKAQVKVSVYQNPDSSTKPVGYVNAGDIVGVVYSWVSPTKNSDPIKIWWLFKDGARQFYIPHQEGLYDRQHLKEQGVLTVEEKREKEEEKDMPWYELLIKKYGIWVIGGLVAAGAARGLFSNKNS